MLIAVVAVLIDIRDTDHWGLIIGGLLVGIVLGVPPALRTKMTAMPQLVALLTRRRWHGRAHRVGRVPQLRRLHPSRRPRCRSSSARLFAAIHRFGLVLGLAGRVREAAGAVQQELREEGRRLGEGVPAGEHDPRGRLGRHRDLIGIQADRPTIRRPRWDRRPARRRRRHGSVRRAGRSAAPTMPVVISLLKRAHRSVGAAAGLALNKPGDDRRRHDRRRVRLDPDQPHGQGHEPLDPRDHLRLVRWR